MTTFSVGSPLRALWTVIVAASPTDASAFPIVVNVGFGSFACVNRESTEAGVPIRCATAA